MNQINNQQTVDSELLAALKTALPYVEKVAATVPTEMMRQQRQRQAVLDVRTIRAILAKAESRP